MCSYLGLLTRFSTVNWPNTFWFLRVLELLPVGGFFLGGLSQHRRFEPSSSRVALSETSPPLAAIRLFRLICDLLHSEELASVEAFPMMNVCFEPLRLFPIRFLP